MTSTMDKLEKARERKRLWARSKVQSNSNIGKIPPVVDEERRNRCERSLLEFCLTYREGAFYLGMSDDHLKIIEQMEASVLDGGLLALAMPRGSGKTTLCITAAIWALLYGHRRWLCLVGATSLKAEDLLKSIMIEMRFNDLLFEDFPEVTFPIRKLEGQAKRATGQTIDGTNTNITWQKNKLVLPTVAGSRSSGGVVSACGITGDIRGQQATNSDGDVLRPDFVVIDDPQTSESAKSHSQTADRIRICYGDILGLSGPGKKISGFMPCTVIKKNDMADQLLNRQEASEWNGIKTKLVYGMPTKMDLWDEYNEIRRDEMINGGNGQVATKFYQDNKEAMDEGCKASWEERFNEDELSAIQNAMNLYYRNQQAFFSEYQNDPVEEDVGQIMEAGEVLEKLSADERGMVPVGADFLTAFIDVQKNMLFYSVVAWKKDFTGTVIKYGTYPEQGTTDFTYATAHKRIDTKYPTLPFESRLTKSLEELIEILCSCTFKSEDGREYSVMKLAVDAAWGESTSIVFNTIRSSTHRALCLPSFGRGIGASSRPLNFKYLNSQTKEQVMLGEEWRIARGKSPLPHLLYDTNHWKSFFQSRLNTPMGSKSCFSLYKAPARHHKMFVDNLLSEVPVLTSGYGRELNEWRHIPGRDNHFLDTIVGNCVLASVCGAKVLNERAKKQKFNTVGVEERKLKTRRRWKKL